MQIGSAVCHQMAERSFMQNGIQMPLCARCTGIYSGAFFAFFYLFWKKRTQADKPFSLPQTMLTAAAILPIGIDGVGSYLGFWESNSFLRILTGSIAGAVVPGFLLLAGNYDPKGENKQSVYDGIAEQLFLIGGTVFFGLCLRAGLPLFAIGAVLSIAGEILLWGGVIWLLLQNLPVRKNFPYWRVALPLAAAVLYGIGGGIA